MDAIKRPGNITSVLERLRRSQDFDADLHRMLDIAIDMTRADMGTLQRFDAKDGCLRIVASRGFSDEILSFFAVVRRDTNSSCAAALTRRMHIFVGDVASSHLFVALPSSMHCAELTSRPRNRRR